MDDLRIRRDALTKPDDPEHVWWDVIERVYDELKTPYEPDPRLERVTPGQRALYALHWMRSEVDNGGFHQYLYNSTGMLANDAERGADLMGATEFGDLLRELLALFPDGRLREEQEDRISFLEGLSEEGLAKLEQLDDRFYDLMGDDPSRLAIHCAAYVQEHPEEFFLPQVQLQP
jgi:Domain of unknown function (DUF4375)